MGVSKQQYVREYALIVHMFFVAILFLKMIIIQHYKKLLGKRMKLLEIVKCTVSHKEEQFENILEINYYFHMQKTYNISAEYKNLQKLEK